MLGLVSLYWVNIRELNNARLTNNRLGVILFSLLFFIIYKFYFSYSVLDKSYNMMLYVIVTDVTVTQLCNMKKNEKF